MYLVLHYALVGRGRSLRIAIWLSYGVQTAALAYVFSVAWNPNSWYVDHGLAEWERQ